MLYTLKNILEYLINTSSKSINNKLKKYENSFCTVYWEIIFPSTRGPERDDTPLVYYLKKKSISQSYVCTLVKKWSHNNKRILYKKGFMNSFNILVINFNKRHNKRQQTISVKANHTLNICKLHLNKIFINKYFRYGIFLWTNCQNYHAHSSVKYYQMLIYNQ